MPLANHSANQAPEIGIMCNCKQYLPDEQGAVGVHQALGVVQPADEGTHPGGASTVDYGSDHPSTVAGGVYDDSAIGVCDCQAPGPPYCVWCVQREREKFTSSPTFLCGNTPATLG